MIEEEDTTDRTIMPTTVSMSFGLRRLPPPERMYSSAAARAIRLNRNPMTHADMR